MTRRHQLIYDRLAELKAARGGIASGASGSMSARGPPPAGNAEVGLAVRVPLPVHDLCMGSGVRPRLSPRTGLVDAVCILNSCFSAYPSFEVRP